MSTDGNNPWNSGRSRFKKNTRSANRPVSHRNSPENAVDVPEAEVRELSSGRLLAWHVLQQFDQTGRFLQDLFSEADRDHDLPLRERAAAVDIASGVVRRRRTIDVIIQSQVTRPRHQIENDLWRTLRTGVYQLVFAKTPDHAAVDSTVELCRLLDRERWTKFVNGVLRGVGRLLTDQQTETPSASSLPLEHGQYRQLLTPVFPDPVTQTADYAADAFSLPASLAARWAGRMTLSDLLTTCFYMSDSPTVILRVNRLRSSPERVTAMLEEHGCHVIPGALKQSLILANASRIERLPGYAEGYWTIQDESASAAALLLKPKSGERILDLCAAPGGKTTHLAELSDDRAYIIACDVSDERLQRVQENVDRLQLTSVTTQRVDRDGGNLPEGPFDAILVDVPCSNSGVLCRRPEARWRFDELEVDSLVQLQTRLLLLACERIAPGGRIVYSTCSMEPEENRGVVDTVLRAFPGFEIRKEQLHLAGQPADGAYQVLLVRPA